MTTLNVTAVVENGRMKIDVPTSLPAGRIDVQVVVESESDGKALRDVSDLIGKLKWQGDAVAETRKLRDEWPD